VNDSKRIVVRSSPERPSHSRQISCDLEVTLPHEATQFQKPFSDEVQAFIMKAVKARRK
jgi:hypothetical protein